MVKVDFFDWDTGNIAAQYPTFCISGYIVLT